MPFSIDALFGRQLIAMPAPAGRPRDRLGHDRAGDLVEPLLDPAQPQMPKPRPEAIHEGRVAEQRERQRRVRPDQQFDPARRLRHVDLVQPQLEVEQIKGPICLAPGPRGEVRRTVDDDPRAVQRSTGQRVAISRSLKGHGPNLTRR